MLSVERESTNTWNPVHNKPKTVLKEETWLGYKTVIKCTEISKPCCTLRKNSNSYVLRYSKTLKCTNQLFPHSPICLFYRRQHKNLDERFGLKERTPELVITRQQDTSWAQIKYMAGSRSVMHKNLCEPAPQGLWLQWGFASDPPLLPFSQLSMSFMHMSWAMQWYTAF